mgnify:CR=1 FL=1
MDWEWLLIQPPIAERISGGVNVYFVSGLREVSRALRAVYPVAARTTAADLLWRGVCSGDKALCALAKKRGATGWDQMLKLAATEGNPEICKLAHKWGATDYNPMLRAAATVGDAVVCRLARDWGATNFGEMFDAACRTRHYDLADLASRWRSNLKRHVPSTPRLRSKHRKSGRNWQHSH